MATYQPPKKNTAFIIYTALVSQADTKLLKSGPTLAAGDFKVSTDGGAFANLATLPTNTPSGVLLKISLSASEMNGDNISIACIDAAGAEWCDQLINIQTSARQIDDLAYPATSGRSMVVDASGLVDANAVKLGPTGSGTTQTARDIGASVLLSSLDSPALESGTAQAGASGSITLRSGASAVNSFYKNQEIEIYGGTGAGQARVINTYTGATKIALIDENWITNPDSTSTYRIKERAPSLTAGAITTVLTLNNPPSDSSGVTTLLTNVGTAGAGLTNLGDTRIANLDATISSRTKPADTQAAVTLVATTTNLTTNNDKTGYGLSSSAIQAIWDALTSALTTVGSIGKLIVTNLDAAISSRGTSTYSGTDTSGTTTLLSRIASALSISGGAVTVGTNNDKNSYTISGTKTTLDTLNDISSANVLTQVNGALDAAGTELSSVPSTTGTLRQKINFLFQYFRNKKTVTATTEILKKEDASTTLGTATVSDDGTTFTKGEMN